MGPAEYKKVTGVILAGGQSKRMGTDKGLFEWNGKKFVDHVYSMLGSIFPDILVISNNPDYKILSYPVIPDEVEGLGPAGGIFTALKYTGRDCLITSCDMPMMSVTTIKRILSEVTNETQAIVFEFNGRTYPFPGFYSQKALDFFQREISESNLKMQAILKSLDAKIIHLDSNDNSHLAIEFLNVNSPVDLELLEGLKNEN